VSGYFANPKGKRLAEVATFSNGLDLPNADLAVLYQ
jgi:hypothetical protein